MKVAVKYEVTAVTGKYTDRDGNEKSRYQKIGVIVPIKSGYMMIMESIPVGWDGRAYLNEPRAVPEPGGKKSEPRMADLQDDPPF